jgi:hypothetical protein
VAETAKTVQAIFDAMAVLKRKHSDDVPQRPRRSRDSVSLAEDAQTVVDLIAQVERKQDDELAKLKRMDEIPKTPRRSRDGADFAPIMDELFGTLESNPFGSSGHNDKQGSKRRNRTSDPSVATTMVSSSNTLMSTSLNSQNRSVDTTTAVIEYLGAKGDVSPTTPIRRSAMEDDASTVMTVEKIPEDTPAQLELHP